MKDRRPRVLAVVRCGDSSLHKSWVGADVDIAISYFGDRDPHFPEAKFVHLYKGGKWDGLFDFFKAFPRVQGEYDYFWFPDDDLRSTPSDIDRLMTTGHALRLDLFQPALDQDSYFSHLITLRHPSFGVRFTDFVEIMAPALSARLLDRALPTMSGTRSGFGLDFLWPRMAGQMPDAAFNVAIIDDVAITHTRPVGGMLHAYVKKIGGRSANEELASTLKAADAAGSARINGVAAPRTHIIGALDRSGRVVSAFDIARHLMTDLLIHGRNRVQPVAATKVLNHAIKAWMGARRRRPNGSAGEPRFARSPSMANSESGD